MSVGVDVPAARLAAALELLAEVVLHPTFPGAEVERLRDERLNDLLQAQADPRRRADEAFVGDDLRAGLALSPAVGRDARDGRGARRGRAPGGVPARPRSGAGDPDRRRRPRRPRRRRRSPSGCSGRGRGSGAIAAASAARSSTRAPSVGRLVRVIHRPGSVQTEIRIGHAACRGGSPTSTPCRSWARSSAGCSTRG